ncbi:HET-domain-containing protein [Pyrenochaeta sp. DS3sAY3a]|nr:HET-domain-containing protein [Pyrenochaeta sp. DS3sAY3a]
MVYAENYSTELTGRRIPENAAHPECLDTIEDWLKKCFEEHKDCARPEAAPLPTRVIDVGPPNGSQAPKLLHAQGMQGQWVALSHRWDRDKFLTTTTGNLNNHLQSIAWHELPRKFQDAMVLTRKLGFRYLWIDSLCIIQDSKEDWIAESSRMGTVYKHSTLNLAAGHPLTSERGIMADRIPAFSPSFPRLDDIRFTYASTSTGAVQSVGVQKFPVYGAFSAEVKHLNILRSRGWVLQEAVLSPRTITWTEEQMIWQCRTGVAAEYQMREHTSMFSHVGKRAYVETHNLKNVFRVLSLDKAFKTASYDLWYMILSVYCESNLTHPGDVLHAISGVAQEIQQGTGDTYCAGIWLNDLGRSLLWYIEEVRGKKEISDARRPLSSYAPSWSWASRKGSESMHIWNVGELEFTDDALYLVNVDSSSKVAGIADGSTLVSMTVKAPMRDSLVGHGDASPWKEGFFYRNAYCRWDVLAANVLVLVYHLDSNDCVQPPDGTDPPKFLEQVWCLAVGTEKVPGSQWQVGLLLQESKKKRGAYQRVGQFRMDSEWVDGLGEWVQREVTIV